MPGGIGNVKMIVSMFSGSWEGLSHDGLEHWIDSGDSRGKLYGLPLVPIHGEACALNDASAQV